MEGDRGADAGRASDTALPGALQRLLFNGLQYARVRLELLELELAAERERLGALLVAGLLCIFAGVIALQLLAALILAYVWNTPWRTPVAAAMLLVVVGAGVAAALWARRLRRQPSRPIAAALRDLDQIVEPLRAGISGDPK